MRTVTLGFAIAAFATTLGLGMQSVAAAPARGASAFDGLWSVLIITEKGTCDRGYRYAVRIKGGRVAHADPSSSSFRINGAVSGNGAIRVSVARGQQSADGSGRMTRDAGAGRWKSADCSGTWQAERRGK
jgi:hypothetical protein